MLTAAAVEASEEEETKTPEDKTKQIGDAFLQSKGAGRKLGEWKLKPFSASREVAAQAMGLHYAYVDAAGKARFKRTAIYPGALRDVIIIMWLCIVADDDQIEAAGVEPKVYSKIANDWAGSVGLLDTESELWQDAFILFFQIVDEVWASRSVPEKKTT